MDSFTNPVILFFIFGIVAGLVRSNLDIPPQIAKFLSLYLLMAIGLKGGFALAESGLTTGVVLVMVIALGMAIAVPLVSYRFLRLFLDGFNAAAVAATYGSISAVTFVTASQFLSRGGIGFDEYLSAAMALMEAPAIIIGVLLASRLRQGSHTTVGTVFRESFTEGANLLLLAALVIGIIAGPTGAELMKPFTGDLFTGLLAFFLLDMGLQVARNVPQVRGKSPALLGYAIGAPLLHAGTVLGICALLGVELGNTVLLMVLSASASYIAVPAAVRQSIPEASPSLYLGLSLGVTFPFNVIIGIPLYHAVARLVLG